LLVRNVAAKKLYNGSTVRGTNFLHSISAICKTVTWNK